MENIPSFSIELQRWVGILLRIMMQNHYRFVKQQGLSMPQMMILYHIQRVGGCTVSDVGEEFGISRAAASQLLERLVQQGYLTRQEHAQDRRVKELFLTELGEELVQKSLQVHQIWLEELVAKIDDKAQGRLLPLIEELVDITEAWANSTTPCER